MNRTFALTFGYLVFILSASAQHRTENFQLPPADTVISRSLYKNLIFVDSRPDTSLLGIVQQGMFNAQARVIPAVPLRVQLQKTLTGLTDSTAQNGTILMQLREFRFSEVTRSMSERGYCYVRADFYEERNNQFYKIDRVDSLITVKAMDVTKGTLKKGAAFLVQIVAAHLTRTASESLSLNFPQLSNIDSVEKSHMAAYMDTVYTDGLYSSYASFRDQTPDKPVTAKEKNEVLTDVKTTGPDGKWHKVNRKQIFAIVISGQAYIATDVDYYPMARYKGQFLFTGRIKMAPSTGDQIATQMMFGMLGTLLMSGNSTLCEVKLDHLSGGFVILRELHIPTEQ